MFRHRYISEGITNYHIIFYVFPLKQQTRIFMLDTYRFLIKPKIFCCNFGDYGIDFSDGDVTKPSIIPRSWYRVRSSTNVKRIEGAFCFHSFPRQTI